METSVEPNTERLRSRSGRYTYCHWLVQDEDRATDRKACRQGTTIPSFHNERSHNHALPFIIFFMSSSGLVKR
jgi:hypothetical protein